MTAICMCGATHLLCEFTSPNSQLTTIVVLQAERLVFEVFPEKIMELNSKLQVCF